MVADRTHSKVVRSLRGGQITLPAEFRRKLGIEDDSLLQVTLEADELRLRPVTITTMSRAALRDLYEQFAPIREEILTQKISEEEVNADIDVALRAVRQQHST